MAATALEAQAQEVQEQLTEEPAAAVGAMLLAVITAVPVS
jgi:hypothetical protein